MRRPDARASDARKKKADRRAGTPALPPVVRERIAEAGASAYQWRDSVLLDLYLPPAPVRIALRVAFWGLQVATALAVLLVASQESASLAVAALVIPFAATALTFFLRKHASAPPPLAWVVAAVIAAYPMISLNSWGALGLVALVLSVIASAEVEHPVRSEVSAWASILLTLVFGALAHSSDMAWGVPFAWIIVLVIVQVPICFVHRSFRLVRHRITPDDLAVRIPPPEFKWEPLAEFVRGTARTMEAIPGVPLVASAFPVNDWIRDIIDGPSEAVMGDALKKAAGGYGERKTGVLLLGLSRGKGTMILHDVALPEAESANIDHVVIGEGREGKPCAFIIDSKFYGLSRLRGNDPGEVTYDTATRGYVHRQGARSRDINKSIDTALWGADAVRRVTGVEDVRVIMAIHNADVASNLAFERHGVPVEIMTAWDLVAQIERRLTDRKSRFRRAGGPLSPIQEARAFQGLVSASTAQRPSVIFPLGLTQKGREFMTGEARQARGGGLSGAEATSLPSLDGVTPSSTVHSEASGGAEYPSAQPSVRQDSTGEGAADKEPSAPQETTFQKADREFFDTDPSEWADDAPPRPPVAPAESAPDQVEGLWDQMRNSAPAPLDDVPSGYHQIVRGTPLTVTSFSDTHGPMAQDVFAITGVCVGEPGNLFLWFCSEEGWRQYQDSGTPVFISTIKVESVVVRGAGE